MARASADSFRKVVIRKNISVSYDDFSVSF